MSVLTDVNIVTGRGEPGSGLFWKMSRAGLSCPGCGSSNIVDDDLYCQAQLVCVDCGSVVSEGVLAHDPVGGSGSSCLSVPVHFVELV